MENIPEAPPKRQRGRPKSQFREGPVETLQSVERALNVLTAVSMLERTTLSDLSLAMGIPTATAHKILRTLQKKSYVSFDEETQDWMIGIEAYRTGASYLKQSSLIEVSQKIMRALVKRTGETANLAVHENFDVIFIGQIETPNPIRAFFPPGSRSPMHASGAGKAILSTMPEDKVRKLMEASGMERFTDNTIISPAALFEELARIRELGWSADLEERYDGMSCIAGVIFDRNAQPLAAVSVSGPNGRFTKSKVAEFGVAVAQAAADFTLQMGGRAPHSWPTATTDR